MHSQNLSFIGARNPGPQPVLQGGLEGLLAFRATSAPSAAASVPYSTSLLDWVNGTLAEALGTRWV